MSPFEIVREISHPYSKTSGEHRHFKTTSFRQPPYSAAAIPFRWMNRKFAWQIAKELRLDVAPDREPSKPDFLRTNRWVQHHHNQGELLRTFFGQIREGKSLCFLYAKQTPLADDGRRVIVGVGRVLHIGTPKEYDYAQEKPLRSYIWDVAVQHSIRPDFSDGFLLPYREFLEYAQNHPSFDPGNAVAYAPDDRMLDFSYGAEHLSHEAAIDGLRSCAKAITIAKDVVPGPWESVLRWIDARIAELWSLRGPCPGLGAALSAFGVELGTLVASAIASGLEGDEDPWPVVDQMFSNPGAHLPPDLANQIGRTLREVWLNLPEERRRLLRLLSRFELTPDQAKMLYVEEEREAADVTCTDRQLLENPYLVFELTTQTAYPVSFEAVDHGVFPSPRIRTRVPLPAPSGMDSSVDKRRVRALATLMLEGAAEDGDSLLPQRDVITRIRETSLEPPCEVNRDILRTAEHVFGGFVEPAEMADGDRAYQLRRLSEVGSQIRAAVERRAKGKRLEIDADWRALLDAQLGNPVDDETEELARQEKVAALRELAESRVSALIGPAGTGKTTLLAVLCAQEQIAAGGVLLLAPTGKARVKMEQASKGVNLTAYTIAQFLFSRDRYDGEANRYHLSDRPPEYVARTVIVDEASMLTEEMLAAVIQSLKGVERLILVGDPRQLPPIGAGRPFVDIVTRLTPGDLGRSFPRVGPGYAELTVRRRQIGGERADLQLAEWFSGRPLNPGDDEVFHAAFQPGGPRTIQFRRWETGEELRKLLLSVLVEDLSLDGIEDIHAFDVSLGAVEPIVDNNFRLGAADRAEAWQILSPVKALSHGVNEINRLIHKTFRRKTLEEARLPRGRVVPRPMGNEEIVYGDKVINVRNHRRRCAEDYQPRDGYIANGEIGVAMGVYKAPGADWTPDELRVEFTSQLRRTYEFTKADFGEEASPVLELAYALTVHKAQGSEFGRVFLVLPNPCRLLSRELLYTALTRQRDRIVILQQGNPLDLKKYASDLYSETAQRYTNLFYNPRPVEVHGRFLEDRLVNTTHRGEPVRSKSEVVIANVLASHHIEYEYETELTFDGITKWPDFTIRDEASGITYYWEHCGMMVDPGYRKRHEAKMAWYRAHQIVPREEGGGTNGTLVLTYDSPAGGISTPEIERIVREVFGV